MKLINFILLSLFIICLVKATSVFEAVKEEQFENIAGNSSDIINKKPSSVKEYGSVSKNSSLDDFDDLTIMKDIDIYLNSIPLDNTSGKADNRFKKFRNANNTIPNQVNKNNNRTHYHHHEVKIEKRFENKTFKFQNKTQVINRVRKQQNNTHHHENHSKGQYTNIHRNKAEKTASSDKNPPKNASITISYKKGRRNIHNATAKKRQRRNHTNMREEDEADQANDVDEDDI